MNPDKMQRRKNRINEEARRERELAAYHLANRHVSDNPIRIADIPYTKFEGLNNEH